MVGAPTTVALAEEEGARERRQRVEAVEHALLEADDARSPQVVALGPAQHAEQADVLRALARSGAQLLRRGAERGPRGAGRALRRVVVVVVVRRAIGQRRHERRARQGVEAGYAAAAVELGLAQRARRGGASSSILLHGDHRFDRRRPALLQGPLGPQELALRRRRGLSLDPFVGGAQAVERAERDAQVLEVLGLVHVARAELGQRREGPLGCGDERRAKSSLGGRSGRRSSACSTVSRAAEQRRAAGERA